MCIRDRGDRPQRLADDDVLEDLLGRRPGRLRDRSAQGAPDLAGEAAQPSGQRDRRGGRGRRRGRRGRRAARAAEAVDQLEVGVGDALGGVAPGGDPGGGAHGAAQLVVLDQLEQALGDGVAVADGDEEAVLAVGDDLAGAVRAVGGDDRDAAAHGLDDGHAERLLAGGHGGDRALGPLGLDGGVGAHEGEGLVEAEPVDLGAQLRLLGAAAVEAELPVGVGGGDRGPGGDQQVVALDGDEPAGGDDELGGGVGGLDLGRGAAVRNADDLRLDAGELLPVGDGVGLGDGGEGVEVRDGRVLVGADGRLVGAVDAVFLADAQVAVLPELGEVHHEAGAGGDDDVGVGRGEVVGDAPVGEGAEVRALRLDGWDVLAVLLEQRVVDVGALLGALVDEVDQPDLGVQGQSGLLAASDDGDDLHVVPGGEGARDVERGADGAADAVRVLQKERDLHGGVCATRPRSPRPSFPLAWVVSGFPLPFGLLVPVVVRRRCAVRTAGEDRWEGFRLPAQPTLWLGSRRKEL